MQTYASLEDLAASQWPPGHSAHQEHDVSWHFSAKFSFPKGGNYTGQPGDLPDVWG